MSRIRRFVGHWIALIAFGIVVPGVFYLITTSVDRALALPPLLPAPYNVFFVALSLTIGLFWVLWPYSYLHFVGLGSPVEVFGIALYPTQRLVTTGPYAYTRNPMFLGLLFLLLAVGFATRSISALVLIPILAVLGVLYLRKYEEPGLVRRFGQEYLEYRNAVPMLTPSFKR